MRLHAARSRAAGGGGEGLAPGVFELVTQLLGNRPPLRLKTWDGGVAGPPDAPVTVELAGPRALRRLLWQPNELGLARAFVSGDIQVEGDLVTALSASPRPQVSPARHDRDPMTDNLRREWASHGIAAERIVFTTRRAEPDYLALFGAADIFLDTWPYNAHTTASDALWMGCPVVTRLGETFAGRVGASLLNAVGLPELVAETTDDYVSLAIALSADPARRALLREKLSRARAESALFDGAATARHVERAFEMMIEQRGSAKRESFEVAPG